MNPRIRLLVGAVLAGATALGHAAYVTVRFDNPIFNGVPSPAYDNVSINYPKQGGIGSSSASVNAGRFQGSIVDYGGVDPSIFVDSTSDLFMYCYDVYEHIGSGWQVAYTINFDGVRARTLDFLGAVNAVLNQGAATFDVFAWLHPGTGAVAAAVQLGIWESLYDSGDWSLANGSFKATGIDGGTQSALHQFFTTIGSSDALDSRYAMTLEAQGAQDMITGDPPAAVPEPGTLSLLGIALAGVLPWRRRQRRSIAAA